MSNELKNTKFIDWPESVRELYLNLLDEWHKSEDTLRGLIHQEYVEKIIQNGGVNNGDFDLERERLIIDLYERHLRKYNKKFFISKVKSLKKEEQKYCAHPDFIRFIDTYLLKLGKDHTHSYLSKPTALDGWPEMKEKILHLRSIFVDLKANLLDVKEYLYSLNKEEPNEESINMPKFPETELSSSRKPYLVSNNLPDEKLFHIFLELLRQAKSLEKFLKDSELSDKEAKSMADTRSFLFYGSILNGVGMANKAFQIDDNDTLDASESKFKMRIINNCNKIIRDIASLTNWIYDIHLHYLKTERKSIDAMGFCFQLKIGELRVKIKERYGG